MEKKKQRKSPRHAFRFKVDEGDNRCIVSWAIVRQAQRAVELTLKAQDVLRSIELNGAGNTEKCAMAICAKRQKAAFPHKVEWYIDWQYRTCYVTTKISKESGLPTECVVYEHSDDIARLIDDPTKAGQKKLLAVLQEKGDRVIRLRPQRKPKPGRESGKRTGERSSRPKSVGARLRFSMAHTGGV